MGASLSPLMMLRAKLHKPPDFSSSYQAGFRGLMYTKEKATTHVENMPDTLFE